MPITNDRGGGPKGPFEDLLRLQTDFQNRLAEETLKYLRQLQGLVGPVVPGTLILPESGAEIAGTGLPGGNVVLRVELENRQRAHSMVSPMLSPLVSDRGVTWLPEADVEPRSVLLASNETATVALDVRVPAETPEGRYRGALILYGFRGGALPVRVDIADARQAEAGSPARPARTRRTRPAAKRSRVR